MESDPSRYDKGVLEIVSQHSDCNSSIYKTGSLPKASLFQQCKRSIYLYPSATMDQVTSRAQVNEGICINCMPGT